MADLHLEVITPQKKMFSGEIKSITVPGVEGSFQVLFNHAPIISALETGAIKIVHSEGKLKYYATSGGTIEVKNNNILILADTFEDIIDLDLERSKRALQRAKERLSNFEDNTIDVERAQKALLRATNRLNLAEKYRTPL